MHNKLFVGNLSSKLGEQQLQALFGEFGTVVSCSIPIDRDTGRKRRWAFVEMASRAEAEAAIKGLNCRDCQGSKISVSVSQPEPKHRGDRRVRVDEMKNAFTIEDIESLNPSFYPTMYFPANWQGTLADILTFNECPAHDRVWVVVKLIGQPLRMLFAEWCANQAEKYAAAAPADDDNDASYFASNAADAVDAANAVDAYDFAADEEAATAAASVMDECGYYHDAAIYVASAASCACATAGAVFGADAADAEWEKQIVKLIELLNDAERAQDLRPGRPLIDNH